MGQWLNTDLPHYDPSSNLGSDTVRGLRLFMVLALASRGIFSGTSVSPSSLTNIS